MDYQEINKVLDRLKEIDYNLSILENRHLTETATFTIWYFRDVEQNQYTLPIPKNLENQLIVGITEMYKDEKKDLINKLQRLTKEVFED